MGTGVSMITLFIVLGILFLVFLLLRELMCWYWKVNEVVTLLKSIDSKLSNDESNKTPTNTDTSFKLTL